MYDKNSGAQFELGMMAIERLSPRDGDSILDVGCGNGLITIELAKRIPNGRVFGLEPAPSMILRAEGNVKNANIKNITLINHGALEINYRDEFDAVFSNSAIHWVDDLNAAYRLIHLALKPGGRTMIQTSPRERNPLIDTIIAIIQDSRFIDYLINSQLPWRFLTVNENKNIFGSCGFSSCNIEEFSHIFKFHTASELAGYLESASMVPFLSALPDALKNPFRENFLERYLEATGGKNEIATTRIFIKAVK